MADSTSTPVAKAFLIAVMAIGSVALWLVVPVGWLWIGSQLQKDSQAAGFGPYMLVLVGIVVSVVVLAKLLAKLNRVYARLSGTEDTVRVRMPWHRSMRGEDDSRPPRSVLDVVMVISVSIAVFIFGVWFFFFAGSSLPS